MSAATKTVKILIALPDLKEKLQEGYKLCIAKMVNNTYNVVWDASEHYNQENTYWWSFSGSLFTTNTFTDGAVVSPITATNIIPGEQCVLGQDGQFEPATTGGPSNAITLINNYGAIYAGQMIPLNGSGNPMPIYVTPQAINEGDNLLEPYDKVLVWFGQNVEQNIMFSDMPPNSIELDLSQQDMLRAQYQNHQWTIISSTDG